MSVLLETSLGDLVIDLFVDQAPKSCENFLKLCKIKHYNYSPIHSIQKNFSLQTGDPIGPGSKDSDGGSSIWGILSPHSPSKKTFEPEFPHKIKHTDRGTVSMATAPNANDPDLKLAGSQFLITLGDNLDYLDTRAAPFGTVVEGFDILEQINSAFVDESGRPLKDIRIRHTAILEDPFPDPEGLVEPPESPVPSAAQLATVRIADDEVLEENADEESLEKLRREREARAQALTLEMVGDLPFAEVAPPENVLFVCKLNPVTSDPDLELIFSRFGKILSCEVIRDKKTGDSLQYAFIEFAEQKDCEQAYFKMDGVLIDDHRIHVDFSQSVSRLSNVWRDATNQKRQRAHPGGFGGIDTLEKKRQYRNEESRGEVRRQREGDRYGIMLDQGGRGSNDASNGREKGDTYRSRSRSPRRMDDRRRERERERSPRRYHDDSYRRREKSRDRYRDDKRRHGSRDRYRESRKDDRRRDRDRYRDRRDDDRRRR